MSDELPLFGGHEDHLKSVPQRPMPQISDRQVSLLREALDARGLVTMDERQRAIETAAGRTVISLRALTQEEAIKVLSRLVQTAPQAAPGNSGWDDREKDTWIDRM